jgi:hypothetical protein
MNIGIVAIKIQHVTTRQRGSEHVLEALLNNSTSKKKKILIFENYFRNVKKNLKFPRKGNILNCPSLKFVGTVTS